MKTGFVYLFICLVLTGCYSNRGDVPESPKAEARRAFTQQSVDAAVAREFVKVSDPLDLNMPYECHSLRYNHFYPRNASQPGSFPDADAVIMLIPGMQAGANVLTYLAEQLVFDAFRNRNANLHVVTLERRNQCLVDNTGLDQAEASGDVLDARAYYYENQPVQGKQFQGYYRDRDVPFLTQFGLDRILTDMYTIARHIYPDPADRRQKLFIGGHSLGGNLTSAFMGWDFDGDPETLDDAGYRQAAGFIRLDISVTPEDPAQDPFLNYGRNGFTVDRDNETNTNYRFAVHQMELGLQPRINRLPGATPETFMLVELVGMQAHQAPEEEATLLTDFSLGSGPSLLLRLIHSKNTLNFITNKPSIFDYRYTNEALLGVILDDDFMPITILQASMGFLSGGPMSAKSFPTNDVIKNLAASVDDFLGFLLTDAELFIPSDAGPDLDNLGTGPLYRWANYDEIGDADDAAYQSADGSVTFTEYREEMADIAQVARIAYTGQTNFTEWYMPQRMSMDIGMIRQPDPVEVLPFWHYAAARNTPLFEVVGTESFAFSDREPLGTLVIADGYNHFDVLIAANDTPEHRENDVFPPLLDFVLGPADAP
ncbi:MAG: hypothetical protein R3208_15295 [Ketobacteraceae bacterium]|nr:hypothetical protein [Ketobacteraceae bacterium]